MFRSFEDVQRLGRENLERAGESLAVVSDGLRAMAADTADYTRKSFETSAASVEKLAAAATLEKAVEIQREFVRASYQDFISHSARFGGLLTDIAKESVKPYEGLLSRAAGK
jgi:hypothetical protein